jgi:colanic acid/amylovoran biosynthesis glycosyltransferase
MLSKSRKPTVCVITPDQDPHSTSFIQAHIERLPAQVRVLYGGRFPIFRDDGRPLLASPTLIDRLAQEVQRQLFGLKYNDFQNAALKKFLLESQIDVVLAEYGKTGVATMSACLEAKVPLVVHFHGLDAYGHDILEEFKEDYPKLFVNAAAIIAVSRDMERQLLSLGAPREKLFYNSCGVDISLFQGADPGIVPPKFLAVGRFVDKKAPYLTILAFKQVLENVPDARLIMVGDGQLLEACKQLARTLKIADSVEFLGEKKHAQVAVIMRQARAFVQHSIKTSYGDSEGTPVSILEAGASGLPVVSTRHAGIQDVVLDGKTGFLVDEGDVDGMAGCMIRLAKDPAMATMLGKAARERISAEFSMEKSIGKLWNIITTACY